MGHSRTPRREGRKPTDGVSPPVGTMALRTQPPPLPPTASEALDSAGDPRQSAGPPMLSALGTPAGIWEIGLPLIVCSVVHW